MSFTVIPSAPSLPLPQVAIIFISWLSFFIYLDLLYIILSKRGRGNLIIDSPVYSIFLYNSIGDICMFFHAEFIMRSRKYRYFSFFDEKTPIWFAYFSYFLMCTYRLVMLMGYVILAVNRFTAFSLPMLYNKIWKPRNVALLTFLNWLLSVTLVTLIFICSPTTFSFSILPNGVLQLLGGDLFLRDAIEVAVVSLVSCLACVFSYAGGAIFVMKQVKSTSAIERKLFVCSLLSSIPLLIESCKAWYLLYGTLNNDMTIVISVAEWWFYWTEIMTSIQCWSVLLITPSARRLLMEEGFMGMFTSRKRNAVVSFTNGPVFSINS